MLQNASGNTVDLYVPRKCSATNRLIQAKDHGSVQINIAHVDTQGAYTVSASSQCDYLNCRCKAWSGAGGLLRRGRLRVDFRSGTCGLELSACDVGYSVDQVDPVPGQPDLEVGDVIVAIGGSTLLGLDEDSVENCFGDAYCDGAIIVAGPLEQLKMWPFGVVREEVQRLMADEAAAAGRSGLLERARTY